MSLGHILLFTSVLLSAWKDGMTRDVRADDPRVTSGGQDQGAPAGKNANPKEDLPKAWKDKITSFFIRFDENMDGVLTSDEYVKRVSERASRFLGEDKALVFGPIWQDTWFYFLHGGIGRDALSVDDIIRAEATAFQTNEYQETGRKWMRSVFKAVLATDSSRITVKEHTAFLACFGVHPLSVPSSFKAQDANSDGFVDEDEFVNQGADFFFSLDDKGKLFWGPDLVVGCS